MKPLEISVVGMEPVAWGSDKTLKWRNHIQDQTRQKAKSIQNYQFDEETQFKVLVKFFLTSPKCISADLDNLAKPVLDTLFLDPHNNSPYPSGVLFSQPDSQIYELNLVKETPEGNALPEGKDSPDYGLWIVIDWQ